MNDPIHKRLLRTIQQGIKTGIAKNISATHLPHMAKLVHHHGLGAHMVHSLHAQLTPDRLALCDKHQQLTYAQLDARINQLGHALQNTFDITQKSPIILMMENRCEYIISWVALFRLGARAVHVSYRSSLDELTYQLEHSDAKHIISSDRNLDVALALKTKYPDIEIILATNSPQNNTYDFNTLIQNQPQHPPSKNRTNASENVVYTSGTTGKPKGAVRNFLGFGITELFRIIERMPVQSGERHLVVCPLYHSGAQALTLLHSALGSTLFLHDNFDAQHTLQTLSQQAIHSVFMGPTMIHRMLALNQDLYDAYPTPALRTLISGAAPFPQALRLAAQARFGENVIFDFYGATELGWVTLIGGREIQQKPGSVGRPIAGQQVHILDESGQTLPPNSIGLIYIDNQQVMSGYLKNTLATNNAKHHNWLTVEDLGYLDDDGYLYICGRARDMIISGGVNIYPVEIEEILSHHPLVKEVAVIGIPDPEWGERLVAVVSTHQTVSEKTLIDFARDQLSSYKIPRVFHFVESLPRNPTGKIIKRTLRETYHD